MKGDKDDMSEKLTSADELDLFELFAILWQWKLIVCLFVIMSYLLGFVYSQLAQPKFKVEVPFYGYEFYSIGHQDLCGFSNHNRCIENAANKKLLSVISTSWELEKLGEIYSLKLNTQNPLDVESYENMFEQLNQKFTSEVYAEAKKELASIEGISTSEVISTERLVLGVLNSNRIIQSVEDGKKALLMGDVSVFKISPRASILVPVAFVLGVFLGIFTVLLRAVIIKRQKSNL